MTNHNSAAPPPTLWHRLLATLLEELLSPVGIQVYTDLPLLSKPPEADILLLRRDLPQWTAEQRLRLPDGIRDSPASHILLEFKYTESINEDAFLQTLSYDTIYKRAKSVTATEVQTFLVSAKTPRAETLTEWGYASTKLPGVYRSQARALRSITLLSLNDLSAEPHNAFIKTFASRRKEKRKAFITVEQAGLTWLTEALECLLVALQTYWFSDTGEEFMKPTLTPEQVIFMGKQRIQAYLAKLPVEERLQFVGLTAQERLSGLSIQERLTDLTVAEIEEYLHQKTSTQLTKGVAKTRSSRK